MRDTVFLGPVLVIPFNAALAHALLAMPATGYLDGIFDLSRPYGSTAQPQLGQLLLPERFVTRVHETSFWQNASRILPPEAPTVMA